MKALTKNLFSILIILALVVITSCHNKYDFEIIFEPKDNYREKIYTTKENYSIYSLDGKVLVKFNEEEISLKEALENNKISMEQILEKAENDFSSNSITAHTYADGGSEEYSYKQYTIIDFNELDGKDDIYFAPPDTTINDIDDNHEMDVTFIPNQNGLMLVQSANKDVSFNTFSYNGDVKIVYEGKEIPLEDAIKNGLDMEFVYYKIDRGDFQKNEDMIKTYKNSFKIYPYSNYKVIKSESNLYFIPSEIPLTEIEKIIK